MKGKMKTCKIEGITKVSVVVACTGKFELTNGYLEFVRKLIELGDQIEILLVTEGCEWQTHPLFQNISHVNKNVRHIHFEDEAHLFSKLFNEGLKVAKGKYIYFTHPGSAYVFEVISDFLLNYSHLLKDNTYVYQRPIELLPISTLGPSEMRYGLCLQERLYEIGDVIIPTELAKNVGGFDQNRFMQKFSDWDFICRVFRENPPIDLGTRMPDIYTTFHYPYKKHYNCNNDLIKRYICRKKTAEFGKDWYIDELYSFLYDLNNFDRNRLGFDAIVNSKGYNTFYKITIIGGYWEYHHIQLAFLNYFEMLQGTGFCSVKVCHDEKVQIDDIRDSNLVIFTRSRNLKLVEIINYCNQYKVSTLYMLDDNWLSAAKDYPHLFGGLFVAGNDQFEAFLYIMRRCDKVLVYNKYLAEDLSKFAKDIVISRLAINLDMYKKDKEIEKKGIVIGYSGSARFIDEPFKALVKVAKKRKNVRILIFGYLTEEQKNILSEIEYINVPPQNYTAYCKTFASLEPDILIAPIDRTRTSMSKCPNKYLEISAVKAAGIYSNTYPYNEVVKNGVNGLLVDRESEIEWGGTILSLVDNPELLERIKKNAYNDVKRNYSCSAVLSDFVKMIESSVEKEISVKGGLKNA